MERSKGTALNESQQRSLVIACRHIDRLLADLEHAFVAIEELTPHHMRGYGAVPPEASVALDAIVDELHETVARLTRFLSGDRDEDLGEAL